MNQHFPPFALDALARVLWQTEPARSVLAALPVEQAREILDVLPETHPARELVAELVAASSKRDETTRATLRELDAERIATTTAAARTTTTRWRPR